LALHAGKRAAMDHQQFLSALPPETRASLIARSRSAGLWHLLGHGGAILGCGALIVLKVPLWPLLLPIQGVLILFLFTLEHECTHRTPFASDALCDRVGQVCGFVLMNPFLWFRYFHLAHHRFTNIPGKDPELDSARPQTRLAWLWHVSGLPIWGSSAQLLGRLALGRERAAYLPARQVPRMVHEARVLVGLYAVAVASLLVSDGVLWVWLVPALLGQPVLRLYLLAEHGDCPAVADMFRNTRTTFTTAVVRFLAWNMPYHVEHHVFPGVPFHNLPRLHRLIRAHLRVTAPGYVAFTRDYLARRR
jgi:fatty acid desaturase